MITVVGYFVAFKRGQRFFFFFFFFLKVISKIWLKSLVFSKTSGKTFKDLMRKVKTLVFSEKSAKLVKCLMR